MDFDYEDAYELEADIYSKEFKTPHQIMEDKFLITYNRNWKEYLNSIEWDGLWLKQNTPEERQRKREEQQQRELENSPFAKWF